MPAENGGSADFCRLVAGFNWAFSLSGPVQKRAVGADAQAGAGALRSFFRSKFKAPKTPPSHGLTGFTAIKPIAKIAVFFRGRARLPRCAPRLCARRKISPGSSGGPLNQGRMGTACKEKSFFAFLIEKISQAAIGRNSLARGMTWFLCSILSG